MALTIFVLTKTGGGWDARSPHSHFLRGEYLPTAVAVEMQEDELTLTSSRLIACIRRTSPAVSPLTYSAERENRPSVKRPVCCASQPPSIPFPHPSVPDVTWLTYLPSRVSFLSPSDLNPNRKPSAVLTSRGCIKMVELRKRKAPPPPPVPAKKKAATGTGRKPGRPKKIEDAKPTAEDAKKADEKPAADEKEAGPAGPTAGATIELDGFGGEIETHDGNKTTLKQLVEESKAGVVLFTYPKANTPGCELACLPPVAPLTHHSRHRPGVRFP